MRYDKEINIMEDLKNLDTSEICVLSDSEESENYQKCQNIILDLINFKKWKDNSKSQFPPDFLNSKDKIMMEVMRTDDHILHKKKNPYRQKEYDTYNELKNLVLQINPNFNTDNIIVNTATDLKTDDDHSYKAYLSNFSKTVNKHKEKINTYKSNYKGYSLCFFLMDESSGSYIENIGYRDTRICQGRPHIFFMDESFVNLFLNAGIDYFIWYAPYKHADIYGPSDFSLPELIFYDLKHISKNKDFKLIKYDSDKMVSSEI